MLKPTRATAALAGLAAVLLSAGPLTTADAVTTSHRTTSVSAASATTGHLPTVVARMRPSAIKLSVGNRMHAGRVKFNVVTKQGSHTLQLLRLHGDYTMEQAGADLNKAFSGDTDAIKRVDRRITWLGGAPTRAGHPSEFVVTLKAAHYVVIDQESNALTTLRVFGTVRPRPAVDVASGITTFSYGFGVSDTTIPKSGWTRIKNRADQPHFVVMQRVKDGTTDRMVRRYVKSGSQRDPSWLAPGGTSVGVLSPGRGQTFHYDLPAGKYVLACFWPDDETGMEHFRMGMWKLIKLT